MQFLFLLLFFLFFIPIDSTPIVSIVRKTLLRPVLLQNGVILTRRHVLTLAHPTLTAIEHRNLLLLTGPLDMRFTSQAMMRRYGYSIRRIAYSGDNENLAVIQTDVPIRFYLHVNRVGIESFTDKSLDGCFFVYAARKSNVWNYKVVSSRRLSSEATSVESVGDKGKNGFIFNGKAHEDMKLCRFDAGTPMFCRYALIGLMNYPMKACDTPQGCYHREVAGHNLCCKFLKDSTYRIRFISVHTNAAVELIKKAKSKNLFL